MTPARTPEPARGALRHAGALFADRAFLLMWCAMLASTAGTFLLLLALSLTLFTGSGSGFQASAVFGVQWLLPLAAAPLIGWLGSRFRPRGVLAAADVAGALLSLAVGFASGSGLLAVFVLLALRGLAEAVTKSVRVVALKRHMRPADLERAASLFNTSQYLGGAVGGLLGAALVERLTLPEIAAIDALTFGFAALCYLLLPAEIRREGAGGPPPTARVWRAARRALAGRPGLLANFHYLLLVTAIFQGFHNVARTPLPVGQLGLGAGGLMLLQVLSSTAIVAGALFVALFMQGPRGRVHPALLVAATAAAMVGAVLLREPVASLALYTVFIFGFEVAFTKVQKDVILDCPDEAIAHVSALANALQMALMMAVVFLGGGLMDHIGLAATAFAAAAVAGVWMLYVRMATAARFDRGAALEAGP